MKNIKNIPALCIIIICILSLIYCGYGFLKTPGLSAGYRLFEDVRMSSAGNGGIILSEKDAFILSEYIESLHRNKVHLYLNGFLLALIISLIACLQIISNGKKKNL